MKSRALKIIMILLLGGALTTVMLSTLTVAPTANAAPASVSYPDQRDALKTAVSWLMDQQNEDGGFSDFGGASNTSGTLGGIIAIGSSGYNADAVYAGQTKSAVDYLRDNITDTAAFAAGNGGSAGKTVLGLAAANQDPTNFGGYNFVISITKQISVTGQYAPDPFKHSLAMLGLRAVSTTIPITATQWIIDRQASDGSWDDGFGTTQNADATAMAMMALLSSGTAVSDPIIISATQFLSATQLVTGGWEYGTGFGENATSTGLVLQALSALGADFYTDNGDWATDGSSLVSILLSYQAENGAFQAFGGDNLYATAQAIPSVTGKAFPINGRYEAARRAVACLDTLQQPDGGWEQFGGYGTNAAGTARTIAAITAFGENPQSARWTTITGTLPISALEQLAPAYLANGRGGRVGVVMQGVVAAGAPYTVTAFAGYNLPISITNYLSPTGEYDHTNFGPMNHAEAMLGLKSAGWMADQTAVSYLRNAQTGGDWGSPDSNGIALQALGERVSGTLDVLHNSQIPTSGGWGGFGLSVNSTAEVVQGLVAVSKNPFAPEWSVVINGRVQNPADAIIATQAASGCWQHSWAPGIDDPYATTDAVLLYMQQPIWEEIMQVYLPLIMK